MTRYEDRERAAALLELQILDTDAEQAFDDIVYIAAQTCDAPIALVSLLDGERQWFKARVGLDVCETPISQSRMQAGNRRTCPVADTGFDRGLADGWQSLGNRTARLPLLCRSTAGPA